MARACGRTARALPFGGREQDVSRREGEPVGVADGGEDAELDVEREVADQRPDRLGLLRVLLAEVDAVRADDLVQLEDDGRDGPEVAGPEHALENCSELYRLDPGLEPGWVHLALGRREHHVDSCCLSRLEVTLLVAGIRGEIRGLAELRGVDEKAHDDGVALASRGAQEGDVPVVERAHGRDEPDRAAAPRRELGTDLGDRPARLHRASRLPIDAIPAGISLPTIAAVASARTR